MVLAIGVLLSAAGLILLINLGGAADVVMRRVTSQPLGELAPGFAASRGGFRTYAALVLAIGVFAIGLGVAGSSLPIRAGPMGVGGVTFGIASVIAIAGEGQKLPTPQPSS